MVTKQVSMDLAEEDILVNAVSPGAVLTERLRGRLGEDVDPADTRAVMGWVGAGDHQDVEAVSTLVK